MYLGIIVLLLYILIKDRRIVLSNVIEALAFYLVISILSHISISFFPLNGDESFYRFCSEEYALTGLRCYPWYECNIIDTNFFVKFLSYIYYLGDGTLYSVQGVNYACHYIACDLISRAVVPLEEIRKKVLTKYNFAFTSLEVEVEETPGQSAVFLHREQL